MKWASVLTCAPQEIFVLKKRLRGLEHANARIFKFIFFVINGVLQKMKRIWWAMWRVQFRKKRTGSMFWRRLPQTLLRNKTLRNNPFVLRNNLSINSMGLLVYDLFSFFLVLLFLFVKSLRCDISVKCCNFSLLYNEINCRCGGFPPNYAKYGKVWKDRRGNVY